MERMRSKSNERINHVVNECKCSRKQRNENNYNQNNAKQRREQVKKEVREANVYIDPNKSKEKIDTHQCISL